MYTNYYLNFGSYFGLLVTSKKRKGPEGGSIEEESPNKKSKLKDGKSKK